MNNDEIKKQGIVLFALANRDAIITETTINKQKRRIFILELQSIKSAYKDRLYYFYAW